MSLDCSKLTGGEAGGGSGKQRLRCPFPMFQLALKHPYLCCILYFLCSLVTTSFNGLYSTEGTQNQNVEWDMTIYKMYRINNPIKLGWTKKKQQQRMCLHGIPDNVQVYKISCRQSCWASRKRVTKWKCILLQSLKAVQFATYVQISQIGADCIHVFDAGRKTIQQDSVDCHALSCGIWFVQCILQDNGTV